MTPLEKTYKMTENPPQPMGWNEYEQKLRDVWNNLLDSNPQEAEVQAFLEKHPCMIPGSRSMTMTSGHYPFPDAVISQPPLVGIGERIPDLMWLATSSLHFEPVLIEIERPDKKWFNSSGTPSADFTQAHSQLAQWKAWFDHPENRLVRIQAQGQEIQTGVQGAGSEQRGVANRGERVVVDDEAEQGVFFLKANHGLHHGEVVAYVQGARGLDSR